MDLPGMSVAGPPSTPAVLSRPGLPTNPASSGPAPASAAAADARDGVSIFGKAAPAQVASSNLELNPGDEVLARVGSLVIQACDVIPHVNQQLEQLRKHAAETGQYVPPEQWEQARKSLILREVKQQVERKLIYLDALHDATAEGLAGFEKQIGEYYETHEFENILKQEKVATRQELEEKYRRQGTSLEREKQAYIERTLVGEWVRQKLKSDKEIPFDEVLAYYKSHLADYEVSARSRWEEVMVRPEKYCGNRADAYNALAQMGNALLRGASLAEIAKARSDGTTAPAGGQRDWITKGSLKYAELDRAIFSLPVGALSPIIETTQGFHIVRVREREEARRKPFEEVQASIRKTIRDQRSKEELERYMAEVQKRTPVTTVFGPIFDQETREAAQPGGRAQ